MGNRLSRIYTRTGDQGDTGIGNGERLPKDEIRIECIGDIDELNSAIGLIKLHDLPAAIALSLLRVQNQLFNVGGELAIPDTDVLTANDAKTLEDDLDRFNEPLAPLKEFILPGGTAGSAHSHMARAVCRRAERRLVSMSREHYVNEHSRIYLNRLSDLLFVIARALNAEAGVSEPQWEHERPKHRS